MSLAHFNVLSMYARYRKSALKKTPTLHLAQIFPTALARNWKVRARIHAQIISCLKLLRAFSLTLGAAEIFTFANSIHIHAHSSISRTLPRLSLSRLFEARERHAARRRARATRRSWRCLLAGDAIVPKLFLEICPACAPRIRTLVSRLREYEYEKLAHEDEAGQYSSSNGSCRYIHASHARARSHTNTHTHTHTPLAGSSRVKQVRNYCVFTAAYASTIGYRSETMSNEMCKEN